MALPQAIKDLAELSPVEDVLLNILRLGLPGVTVRSLIPLDASFPLVIVRRAPGFGEWQGDTRFLDVAEVNIHAFTEDPNGDEDGAILSEAVRVVLRNAWFNKRVVPGLGSITSLRMTDAPRRVTDWATSTGPVQYADLPSGCWRYETTYKVGIRKAA